MLSTNLGSKFETKVMAPQKPYFPTFSPSVFSGGYAKRAFVEPQFS